MYMLPWLLDVSYGMASRISMCKTNRLSVEKYVPTPGLRGGSRSYMKSCCMHVYIEMSEFLVERTTVFILTICVSKWILSCEIVPYDI